MDRRRFIHGMLGAGLTAASPNFGSVLAAEGVSGSSRVNSVAIIGAGIVGASIAYNLSKRGCRVTVIEKNTPASQATGNSFAWINASYFDTPHSYYTLRTHSLNEYHRLVTKVRDTGGVVTYLRFPDEGHSISKQPNRVAYYRAMVGFLEKHLKPREEDTKD